MLSPAFSAEIHKSGHLLYQLLVVTARKGNKTENMVHFDGFFNSHFSTSHCDKILQALPKNKISMRTKGLFLVKVSPPLSGFCIAKKCLNIYMCGGVYIESLSVYLFIDLVYTQFFISPKQFPRFGAEQQSKPALSRRLTQALVAVGYLTFLWLNIGLG